MKVLFLNNSLDSATGAGKFYHSLAAALKKEDRSLIVSVLTHDNGLPTKRLNMLAYLPELRRQCKEQDIVHALDGWPYGVLAALATLGLETKLIITAVGTGAVKPLYDGWLKRLLLTWAYRRADHIVAISSFTEKEILKKCAGLKISVINHGVDQNVGQDVQQLPDTDTQRLRKPYILSIGTLKQRKGYFYSLEAFSQIAKEFLDITYVIVGRGPARARFETQIKEHGLESRVIFFESVGEAALKNLYRNAELFILLSQNINHDIEGFGLVFLEAAQAGLPCIGTENSGAVDAIMQDRTGFLVPQRDSSTAAQKMREILSDKKTRDHLSSQAKEFAKQKSWDAVAKKYVLVYRAHE